MDPNFVSFVTQGTNDFIAFIENENLAESLATTKGIFIFFSILFGGCCIYLLKTSNYINDNFLVDFKELWTYHPLNTFERLKKWGKIQRRIATGIEAEYKLAVLEAWDIMEKVLEDNYSGETLEEQLDAAQQVFPQYIDTIKKAYELKEKIVTDANLELPVDLPKKIIDDFTVVLQKVRYLPT